MIRSDGEPQFTEKELVEHVSYIQARQDCLTRKSAAAAAAAAAVAQKG